jgi:hypothetical protein
MGTQPESAEQKPAKYPKPKILLIDMPKETMAHLAGHGFTVSNGTFGNPYMVQRNDKITPVIPRFNLPNLYEQEVLFIDLTPPPVLEQPSGKKLNSMGVKDLWVRCNQDKVDPRPYAMTIHEAEFHRIYQHGGIIIVFCEPRVYQTLYWNTNSELYHHKMNPVNLDTYSFMIFLSHTFLDIRPAHGTEIQVALPNTKLNAFLRKAKLTACFHATFAPLHYFGTESRSSYGPCILDKYDNFVGLHLENEQLGQLLLLPQLNDKPAIAASLLTELLPAIAPNLFPYHKKGLWVQEREYQHPSILALQDKRQTVIDRALKEIDATDIEIYKQSEQWEFLHGLITKAGSQLVSDIARALSVIGFKQVTNLDNELKEGENPQEDLQVLDLPQPVLLECKGLTQMPREDDALQVHKYILRRMKEWKSEVQGVCIVNHQRLIPPLNRNHENVFTQTQIQDALNHEICLMTTWQLFLLIRAMLKYNWNSKVIRDLFYLKGKCSGLPSHYKLLGHVGHYFDAKKVIGIDITTDLILRPGAVVGYALPGEFLEEAVDEIQLECKPVQQAGNGPRVGMKTQFSRSQVGEGKMVYLVTDTEPPISPSCH